MRYTAHMTSVLGLLAVCLAYAVTASLFCENLPTFVPSEVLKYSVSMWGIAGVVGVIVGSLYFFDNRKSHLIYISWTLAIPFVEIFLAVSLFGEHWMLPLPSETAQLPKQGS